VVRKRTQSQSPDNLHQGEKQMTDQNVKALLLRLGIEVQKIKRHAGSFGRTIYSLNDALLLRVSPAPMDGEISKIQRVKSLRHVPKIQFTGLFESADGPIHYVLLDLLPGSDFFDLCPGLDAESQVGLAGGVAGFLRQLHSLKSDAYDIGHYLPVFPAYGKSWREGHGEYRNWLFQQIAELTLDQGSRMALDKAFDYMEKQAGALDFQAGPCLLHNDFHPKNIIVQQGKFSGVIDWECSQYGEADFDLFHFFHWSLFLPVRGKDFRPFISALFQSSLPCVRTPGLERRLTIYQLEHEIIQLVWSKGKSQGQRIPQLRAWMDGAVSKLLEECGYKV
jgi:aminoglycoside phosphotransferase (APT) family kinase protein